MMNEGVIIKIDGNTHLEINKDSAQYKYEVKDRKDIEIKVMKCTERTKNKKTFTPAYKIRLNYFEAQRLIKGLEFVQIIKGG